MTGGFYPRFGHQTTVHQHQLGTAAVRHLLQLLFFKHTFAFILGLFLALLFLSDSSPIIVLSCRSVRHSLLILNLLKLLDLPMLLHGFVKIDNWIYKFSQGFVKICIYGFLQVVTWICQSCSRYFSLFAKQNQDFKPCWSFCFVKVLKSQSTEWWMPWVRCAGSNVLFSSLQKRTKLMRIKIKIKLFHSHLILAVSIWYLMCAKYEHLDHPWPQNSERSKCIAHCTRFKSDFSPTIYDTRTGLKCIVLS